MGHLTAGLLVVVLAIGCASEATSELGDGPATERSTTTRDQLTTTERPTTTAKPYHTPVPEDFSIDVVTLEKSCFGSAGCNVTFTVELNYLGLEDLDPSGRWTLIYEIHGGDSVDINNLELEGSGSYTYQEEDFISTPSEDAVLTAVVTSVREAP